MSIPPASHPGGSVPACAPGSPFCEALLFFYACGCRERDPFFCCRPPPPADGSPQPHNPCRHETPSVVLAKLPHACGSRLGRAPACGAADPGARAFVREVDTAERLELAVLDGLARGEIDGALPRRVEGSFTVSQLAASRSVLGGKDEESAAAAGASPVVIPELKRTVTISAAHKAGVLTETTKLRTGTPWASTAPHRHVKSQIRLRDRVPAARALRVVTQHIRPEEDDSDSSAEFFDVVPSYSARDEEPELSASKTEREPPKISYWGIFSLLGMFS
ncbi:hypothetical protein F4802DRAFT_620844 [Xylaria palmicola]|nr:hypothetical protein F4802DRAFT_620844 [Xylaria palmicola]